MANPAVRDVPKAVPLFVMFPNLFDIFAKAVRHL
jgi:hypothetical protein